VLLFVQVRTSENLAGKQGNIAHPVDRGSPTTTAALRINGVPFREISVLAEKG
jgi:hypothetical protein